MKAFAAKRGYAVGYFFILDESRPVLPFGLCGPFSKRREAKRAASKLQNLLPQSLLGVYGATLHGTAFSPEAMTKARLRARDKLKTMLGQPVQSRRHADHNAAQE